MAELSAPALIREGVLLSEQCRFRVGGSADWFAAVRDEAQLHSALAFARERGLRHFVYAGGSNLFFDDAGFRGLVVRVQGGGWRVDTRQIQQSTYVNVERSSPRQGMAGQPVADAGAGPVADAVPVAAVDAGYDLPQLVRELAARGLGGIEFLGNIPGSVGGAVVGNAGCYGRAIAEVLVEVEVYDVANQRSFTAPPEWLGFAYRHSRLKFDPDYVVLSATLRLAPRAGADVLAEVEGELAHRLSKHPHFAACAGSFFTNPPGYPAWRAITEAGLAGARVGGAMLHPMHINFLVNDGGATSADIIALVRKVQAAVKDKLGIDLEPEVRYAGPEGIVPL